MLLTVLRFSHSLFLRIAAVAACWANQSAYSGYNRNL